MKIMMLNLKCLFFLLSLSLHCQAYPGCFESELTWVHDSVVDSLDGTDTPLSCQNECSKNDKCTDFTWYKDSELNPQYPEVCYLFSSPGATKACSDCLSGPSSCTCSSSQTCVDTGDNILGVFTQIEQEVICQNLCYGTVGCQFYTFTVGSLNDCMLFSSCDVKEDCPQCVSGPAECSWPPTTTMKPTMPPTTEAPTTKPPTEAPTTKPPTEVPTTEAPTTKPPTDAPTTKPPTEAPTTEAHTTKPPTEAPTTKPPTEAPTTEAPTTKPPTEAPTTKAPTTKPLTDAPTTKPPTEAPTTNPPTDVPTTKPPTEAPTTEAPTTKPPTEAPTTEAPTTKPPTGAPTTEAPTTKPPTEAPTTNPPTEAPTTIPPTEAPTTAPTTSKPDSQCPIPSSPPNGYWFCPPVLGPNSPFPPACHLECNPGYASSSNTLTYCTHDSWTIPPENMTCSLALALVTGGQYYVNRDDFGHAELYGEGIHTEEAPLPEYREGHSTSYVDSHVLTCGDDYSDADTSCVELTAEGWMPHSTLTERRKGHSSAVMLGKLYLLGGHISPQTSEVLFPSDVTEWVPGNNLAVNTWESCSVKITPEVYIVTGGYDTPNEVWQYDITKGTQTRLADMIYGRSSHGCAFVKDDNSGNMGVIVAGGELNHKDISTTEFYILDQGVWRQMGDLNLKRMGVRLAVIQGGQVLALGGSDGGTERHSSVEKLNLESESWSFTEDMIEARKYHAITTVPSEMFYK